ncbi:MAG: copper resistance protein B [Pacificimonas sp.]
MKTFIAALLIGCAAPAIAQHQGHVMPAEPKADAPAAGHDLMDHAQMDHGPMGHGESADAEAAEDMPVDHGEMDHGKMDHSAMGHGDVTTMPSADIPNAPPPPEAGSGPPRAADAIWGEEAMRASRARLKHNQGGQTYFWFMADRADYRAREGGDGYLWDAQGYYGGDLERFWFETEGEGGFGEKIESADVQALYSRAIAPFFDLQVGVRQDFAPRDRTYAVVGFQGLAPYLFEAEGDLYLSDRGDLTATFEAELDQRITQRLILQPRAEVNLSAQDVPELGIGAGLDSVEAGLRLRYELSREFAPYVGVAQEWKTGDSADFARAEGEDPSVTSYVVGVRFWF